MDKIDAAVLQPPTRRVYSCTDLRMPLLGTSSVESDGRRHIHQVAFFTALLLRSSGTPSNGTPGHE